LHFSLYWAHKNLINRVGHLITKTILKLPKGTFPFQRVVVKSPHEGCNLAMMPPTKNLLGRLIFSYSCSFVMQYIS
jgi:hypothetical protein